MHFVTKPAAKAVLRRAGKHTIVPRFGADERGGVATIFAVSFIPAMMIAGAAIDYSRSVTQWSNLQQATDATALSIAHTFLNQNTTQAQAQTYAQSYISGLMNNVTVTNVQLLQGNSQACVYSSFNVKLAFMPIVGIKTTAVTTQSCSQTNGTVEVAVALDNSGSMTQSAGGQSKMDALKSAMTQLVSILIPSGTTNPSAAISIVPFTAMVNSGAGGTNSPTAAFMDTAGASSIHWQNFHIPSNGSFKPTSKFSLFSALKGNQTWGGCMEERPYPYITTDTAASSSTPDTMFVPYLAPDEPGAADTAYNAQNQSGGYTTYTPSGQKQATAAYFNSYISDSGAGSTVGVCSGNDVYAQADNASSNIYPGAGITEVCKYKNSNVTAVQTALGNGAGAQNTSGPNFECTLAPITPLTTSSSTLNTSISNLVAGGGTNLASGFMWAWRTISPVVNPFPTQSTAPIGPQAPKSYTQSSPANAKFIILMTDGYNSWTQNPYDGYFQSMYEGFGYYAYNRLANYTSSSLHGGTSCSGNFASMSRCIMDNATLEACTNAKAAGVTVFTIGFSVTNYPIDQQGLNLLQNCASGTADYYVATDSNSINAAFQSIAAQIQNLRLTQ